MEADAPILAREPRMTAEFVASGEIFDVRGLFSHCFLNLDLIDCDSKNVHQSPTVFASLGFHVTYFILEGS